MPIYTSEVKNTTIVTKNSGVASTIDSAFELYDPENNVGGGTGWAVIKTAINLGDTTAGGIQYVAGNSGSPYGASIGGLAELRILEKIPGSTILTISFWATRADIFDVGTDQVDHDFPDPGQDEDLQIRFHSQSDWSGNPSTTLVPNTGNPPHLKTPFKKSVTNSLSESLSDAASSPDDSATLDTTDVSSDLTLHYFEVVINVPAGGRFYALRNTSNTVTGDNFKVIKFGYSYRGDEEDINEPGKMTSNDDIILQVDANQSSIADNSKFSFLNGSSTEVARIDEQGNMTLVGQEEQGDLYLQRHQSELTAGNEAGRVLFQGTENGTDVKTLGGVTMRLTEDFGFGSAHGSALDFYTTQKGNNSNAKAMSIDSHQSLNLFGGITQNDAVLVTAGSTTNAAKWAKLVTTAQAGTSQDAQTGTFLVQATGNIGFDPSNFPGWTFLLDVSFMPRSSSTAGNEYYYDTSSWARVTYLSPPPSNWDPSTHIKLTWEDRQTGHAHVWFKTNNSRIYCYLTNLGNSRNFGFSNTGFIAAANNGESGWQELEEALTGEINPDGTTTVTGNGTAFTTELKVGDHIKVNTEIRTVETITDDTTLTTSVAFSAGSNDTTPQKVVLAGVGREKAGELVDSIFKGLTLKNTENNANGSIINFIKDKGAAGADGDDIGTIKFTADNSAQEQTDFAKILGEVRESADGDEAGKLTFWAASTDGETSSLVEGLEIRGSKTSATKVDVDIGADAASLVTLAGDLKVTGNSIQSSGGTPITLDGNNIEVKGELSFADNGLITTAGGGHNLDLIAGHGMRFVIDEQDSNTSRAFTWYKQSITPSTNEIARLNEDGTLNLQGGFAVGEDNPTIGLVGQFSGTSFTIANGGSVTANQDLTVDGDFIANDTAEFKKGIKSSLGTQIGPMVPDNQAGYWIKFANLVETIESASHNENAHALFLIKFCNYQHKRTDSTVTLMLDVVFPNDHDHGDGGNSDRMDPRMLIEVFDNYFLGYDHNDSDGIEFDPLRFIELIWVDDTVNPKAELWFRAPSSFGTLYVTMLSGNRDTGPYFNSEWNLHTSGTWQTDGTDRRFGVAAAAGHANNDNVHVAPHHFGSVVDASTLGSGQNDNKYEIVSVGTTNWGNIGYLGHAEPGVIFVKTGNQGDGDGTVRQVTSLGVAKLTNKIFNRLDIKSDTYGAISTANGGGGFSGHPQIVIDSKQHAQLELRGAEDHEVAIIYKTNDAEKWKAGLDNAPATHQDGFSIKHTNNTTPSFYIHTDGDIEGTAWSQTFQLRIYHPGNSGATVAFTMMPATNRAFGAITYLPYSGASDNDYADQISEMDSGENTGAASTAVNYYNLGYMSYICPYDLQVDGMHWMWQGEYIPLTNGQNTAIDAEMRLFFHQSLHDEGSYPNSDDWGYQLKTWKQMGTALHLATSGEVVTIAAPSSTIYNAGDKMAVTFLWDPQVASQTWWHEDFDGADSYVNTAQTAYATVVMFGRKIGGTKIKGRNIPE